MQAGYFKTAWNDLRNSPGWFGKMLLLGLLMLIPVFGPIVAHGYFYGWARDIAWGIHAPMPKSLFGNEDGKLYSRGFYILVVGVVVSAIIWILEAIQNAVFGVGLFTALYDSSYTSSSNVFGTLAASGIFSIIFSILIFLVSCVLSFFQWVADMRVSIYGTLSAGFQVGKIWKMIKHDFQGLLRIFGMSLLIGLIIGVIVCILIFIIIALVFAASGGAIVSGSSSSVDSSMVGAILGVGFLSFILIMVFGYVIVVIAMMSQALISRALGYWTRQFDVPNWRGQNDPMPFELMGQQPYQGTVPPAQSMPQQPPVQQPTEQPTQPDQQPPAQS